MCSRINQHQITAQELMDQFDAEPPEDHWELPFDINMGIGSTIIVLYNATSAPIISTGKFGLTPSWSDKRMAYFNARIEGSDANKENSSTYNGPFDITKSKVFAKAVNKQRCIVPVRSFIEGTQHEKLDKPFLIEKSGGEIMALAGIFELWEDPQTGEVSSTVALLTHAANNSLLSIGHHRSPLILNSTTCRYWFNYELTTHEILNTCYIDSLQTELITQPLNPAKIKSGNYHGIDALNPYQSPNLTLF